MFVDVTRHGKCCAKICEPRRTTWCVLVERRATSTNPSIDRIISMRSIRARQFGEADKRPWSRLPHFFGDPQSERTAGKGKNKGGP